MVQRALVVMLVGLGLAGCGERPECRVRPATASLEYLGYGVAGEAASMLLSGGPSWGCEAPKLTATVRVLGPDQVEHPGTVQVAMLEFEAIPTVKFTPTQPGTWTVTVTWSVGGEQTAQLLVAEPVETDGPSVTRTYVDRVDACQFGGPYVTSSGLLLCARDDDRVWVYDTQGAILESFPGRNLVVVGSDVWTALGADIEHRSDVGGALRLDGRVTDSFATGVGPTAPGRYIKEVGDGALVMTWNGAALDAERLVTPIPTASGVIVPEGGKLWNERGCFARPGCQQTACGNVEVCAPEQMPIAVTVDERAAWGWGDFVVPANQRFKRVEVVMRPRPFDVSAPLVRQVVFYEQYVGSHHRGTLRPPQRLAVETTHHLLLPVRAAEGIRFKAHLRGGTGVLSVTDAWIIEAKDPFTVVLTPLRALQP